MELPYTNCNYPTMCYILKTSQVTQFIAGSFFKSSQVPQLFKKFPAFYGNRKFITALIMSANWPCPQPDQSCLGLPIPL